VIFTADYGEASAINVLGQGTGLPAAVSRHNTYWWWGPGNPHATTVAAVNPGPRDAAYLRQFFTSVGAVATLSNPYRIHDGEYAGQVYLRTGPPPPASRGASCGHGCGATADSTPTTTAGTQIWIGHEIWLRQR
jgi:hypothetical protein